MNPKPVIVQARGDFHCALLNGVLSVDKDGVPNIADRGSSVSISIAKELVSRLGYAQTRVKGKGQTSGKKFEEAVADYLRATFLRLGHLRPGDWEVRDRRSNQPVKISNFEQYEHLAKLMQKIEEDPEIAAALGADYLITPDVVVLRRPVPEEQLNAPVSIADEKYARLTPLRRINRLKGDSTGPGGPAFTGTLLLHASVSCKWTLRSDRAQNARSEALNLIRNRKGRVPHIVAITAEPVPSRLASLALGTSDLDCVYHIALPELRASVEALGRKRLSEHGRASGFDHQAVQDLGREGSSEQDRALATLVAGKRLRDISDLPLDLAI